MAETQAQPAGPAQDGSMEDILQSIRRIIAEESDNAKEPVSAGSSVLELTEIVSEPESEPEPAAAGDVLSNIDAMLGSPAPEPMVTPAPSPPIVKPEPQSVIESDSLLSQEAAIASAAALKSLHEISKDTRSTTPAPIFRSGETLEDLALEAMKPVIKTWLDANLPAIVERIVEKEVRRVTSLNS